MDFLLHNLWLIIVTLAVSGFAALYYYMQGASKRLEKKILSAFEAKDYASVIEIASPRPPQEFSLPARLAFARSLSQSPEHYHRAVYAYRSLAAAISPSDALQTELLTEEADIHLKIGDKKKAEECYRIACEKEPSDPKTAYKYADFFYKIGAHNRCLPILEHLLSYAEDNRPARFLLAEAQASLGFFDKAIRHYEILNKAHFKLNSYRYAKTLKENGFEDEALPLYLTIASSPKSPPYEGYDAPHWDEIWEKAVRDCANIYLKKENGTAEGIPFIDSCLPNAGKAFSKELRARKAEMFASVGADFTALEILSGIYKEDPSYHESKSLVENWGKALNYPFLNDYYTPDKARFERLIKNMISKDISILKWDDAYCYCMLGSSAYVFHRRIRPLMPDIIQRLNWDFRTLMPSLSTLNLYSLNGLTKNAEVVVDKSYFFALHWGTAFLRAVAGAISQERGTVKFPDLKYEDL